jgi:hypothetical protein
MKQKWVAAAKRLKDIEKIVGVPDERSHDLTPAPQRWETEDSHGFGCRESLPENKESALEETFVLDGQA